MFAVDLRFNTKCNLSNSHDASLHDTHAVINTGRSYLPTGSGNADLGSTNHVVVLLYSSAQIRETGSYLCDRLTVKFHFPHNPQSHLATIGGLSDSELHNYSARSPCVVSMSASQLSRGSDNHQSILYVPVTFIV